MAFNAMRQRAKDLRNSIKIVAEIVPKKRRLNDVEHKLEREQMMVKRGPLLEEAERLRNSIKERRAYAESIKYAFSDDDSIIICERLSNLSESEFIAALLILDPEDLKYLPPVKGVSEEKVKKLKRIASISHELLIKEI